MKGTRLLQGFVKGIKVGSILQEGGWGKERRKADIFWRLICMDFSGFVWFSLASGKSLSSHHHHQEKTQNVMKIVQGSFEDWNLGRKYKSQY
jgi:hypothetical protein